MGSTGPATAIVPINLGTAAAFDQSVFPLAYYEGGNNLSKGTFLIRATLDEMEKIAQLGIDLNKNEDFIFNTRLNLETLRAQEEKILDNRKTLNPFKAFLNYRTARLFHAGSRALYLETKRTSERIHREEEHVQVVPSTQMRIVNGMISPTAPLVGISIDLPDGWNDNVRRTINDATTTIATTDPFQDNSIISQLRDDEHAITLTDTTSFLSQEVPDSGVDDGNRTSVASSDMQSRPTSPQTINIINIIRDSVLTGSSNVTGLTVSNRGSQNSGASVTQEFTP
ncbi:hypothetical protein V8E55_005075 [Tylopilus felleus]